MYYLAELKKTENMKLKNEKLQCDLESQKGELERLIKEKNKLMQETNNTELEVVEYCSKPCKGELNVQPREPEDSRVQTVEEINCSMVGKTERCFIMLYSGCNIKMIYFLVFYFSRCKCKTQKI